MALPALAQNKTQQGSVVDETGEPVIGATVKVEGTNVATVTDLDGNYKLDVPKNGKVVISYIGYKDVVTTGGRVQLEEDNSTLEEVVVVVVGLVTSVEELLLSWSKVFFSSLRGFNPI
jgi:hypothetical protein